MPRVFHFFLVSTWRTLPREDNVYFAELVQSQLKPDGKGLGTFLWNGAVSDVNEPTTPSMGGVSEGSLLKYVDRG